MNISKITEPSLANGLKEQSLERVNDTVDNEKDLRLEIEEENYDSEDEIFEDDNMIDKYVSNSNILEDIVSIDNKSELYKDDKKMLNEDSNLHTKVDDVHSLSQNNVSSIIIEHKDDSHAVSCEHEIIDISDEVVIDDEDHQVNKKDISLKHQNQQEVYDLESGESRDTDSDDNEEKIKVWVHNVPLGVTAVELKELFAKYVEVILAEIIGQRKDCFDKCSGCVQLRSNEDVKKCINNLNQTEFRGNTITVCKDACFTSEKDKIQRMISPISSNGSWGGKSRSRSVSLMSPVNGDTATPLNDYKDDEVKKSYPAPYRGRGGCRGNYFGSKNNNENDDQESRGRDYRRATNDIRGNYRSGQARDEPSKCFKSVTSDNRPRGNFHQRDVGGGGRNDFSSSNQSRNQYHEPHNQSNESRYQPYESRYQPNGSHHQTQESRYRQIDSRCPPTDLRYKPMDSRRQPSESRYKPTDSRRQPSESRYKPMDSRRQPSESRYKPMESRRQPSESRYKPMESRRQSNESRFKPMESYIQPNELRYKPMESRYKPAEPRHEPVSRDKRMSRECLADRYKNTRLDEDKGRLSPKYGNTDRYYDGRSNKRPAVSDYSSANSDYIGRGKREEVPLKRPRHDNSDVYVHKRLREEVHNDRAAPKHSFYPEKEYRDRTDYRDREDHLPSERSVRDFQPRKSVDLGCRKSFYPPARRDGRVHDCPSNFVARSRNFGH